jgi:hypothetical protein
MQNENSFSNFAEAKQIFERSSKIERAEDRAKARFLALLRRCR